MNVDDPVWIGIHHDLRDDHKAAGQHHKIHLIGLDFLKESPVEGLPGLIILRGHHGRVDTVLLRPLKSVSRAVIADYNGDLSVGHGSVSNAVNDRLEIGPAAGDQDCHSQHTVTPFSPASM